MSARRAAAVGAVAIAAVATWWTIDRRDGTTPAPASADGPVALVTARLGRGVPAQRVPVRHRAVLDGDDDDVGIAPEDELAIATTDVLAEVNGVAIRLADLMAIEPGERERVLDPVTLRFLLDRAIERELVAQAARAAKIELTDEQRAALAARRAQLAERAPGTIAAITATDAGIAFAIRDAEGLMLRGDLVAASGAPSPHVEPADVDAYYREHQRELPALPADPAARAVAWRTIDGTIRERLATAQAAAYTQAVHDTMAALRARAQVSEGPQLAATD